MGSAPQDVEEDADVDDFLVGSAAAPTEDFSQQLTCCIQLTPFTATTTTVAIVIVVTFTLQ